MRYEDPQPLPHDEAEAVFASGDDTAICNALVGAALHDEDAAWVESWCLRLGGSHSADVRGLAATCLGHVARRFGAIRPESLELLRNLRDDPAVGGRADDALDDVRTFTNRGT
jgi:hypothetical protein